MHINRMFAQMHVTGFEKTHPAPRPKRITTGNVPDVWRYKYLYRAVQNLH